jgi:hypothetical protein
MPRLLLLRTSGASVFSSFRREAPFHGGATLGDVLAELYSRMEKNAIEGSHTAESGWPELTP